jgi:hypothetical protein
VNEEIYAVAIVDNRYARDAVVELTQPPEGWRVPEDYVYLRCFDGMSGESYLQDLVTTERIREAWFDLTGIQLEACIYEHPNRSCGRPGPGPRRND